MTNFISERRSLIFEWVNLQIVDADAASKAMALTDDEESALGLPSLRINSRMLKDATREHLHRNRASSPSTTFSKILDEALISEGIETEKKNVETAKLI